MTPNRSRALLIVGAAGACWLTANHAVAAASTVVAVTASAGAVVAGMITVALNVPDAVVVKAAVAVPAITVPGRFLPNPAPVTVTLVPTGPALGESASVPVAALAGVGTAITPIRRPKATATAAPALRIRDIGVPSSRCIPPRFTGTIPRAACGRGYSRAKTRASSEGRAAKV